mmetsp:Transcript_6784/g.6958  ORF Transcript_6784/g.6958 Transcript_6784/m.6958 type:complete len:81 (-) Transcript_6784:98-340(-)
MRIDIALPRGNRSTHWKSLTSTELRDLCSDHGIVLSAYSSLESSDPVCQAELRNHPTVLRIARDHTRDSATGFDLVGITA